MRKSSVLGGKPPATAGRIQRRGSQFEAAPPPVKRRPTAVALAPVRVPGSAAKPASAETASASSALDLVTKPTTPHAPPQKPTRKAQSKSATPPPSADNKTKGSSSPHRADKAAKSKSTQGVPKPPADAAAAAEPKRLAEAKPPRRLQHSQHVSVVSDGGGGGEASEADALLEQMRAAESTKELESGLELAALTALEESPGKPPDSQPPQLPLSQPPPLSKPDLPLPADADADVQADLEAAQPASPSKSSAFATTAAAAHKPAKKISLCSEMMSVVLAVLSVLMTWLSYMSLSKSATIVEPVLRNWRQQPLLLVHFVQPSQECPADSEAGANTAMTWPGLAGIGCACTDASYQSSSFGSACSTAQLAADCVTDEGVPAMSLSSWRGTKICLQRGGQAVFSESWDGSVVKRPNPDPEIPHQCPEGYRRCGRTSMDDWRATCTIEEEECPVTLLASQSVFPNYGSVEQLTALFANNQASRADQPFLKQTAAGETLSLAESSLVVSKQLPLVEFTAAFMHPGSDYPYLGPCNQDVPAHDNMQSTYKGEATFSSADPGDIDFKHPATCDKGGSLLDSRWKPYDSQSEAAVFQDNFLSSEECAGLPEGDLATAYSTNYFASGTRCTTYSGAPTAMQCSSGVVGDEVCADSDPVCESRYYQSRCGRLMSVLQAALDAEAASTAPRIGLFARNEIYWKEQCDSSYNEVMSNDAPLQRAVQAITALLGINGFMNLCTIAISLVVIFIWEFNIDLPCIDGSMKEDAAFLLLLTEKISGACKVVKVVPCVVALIYLSYVLDFYEELADVGCSDATTNMNFNEVGATLPSSFQFCWITLLMDGVHFLMPYLRKWWRRCRGLDSGTQLAAAVLPVSVSTEEEEDK